MECDFQIREWLVKPLSNTLISAEKTIHVEPKILSVLLCLIEHAGEVVSKEQLIQSVWEERFVSDEVLTVAIHELRKALGDNTKSPRFIKTVPKVGYRLIAPVSQVNDLANADEKSQRSISVKWKWQLGVAGGLLLTISILGLLLSSRWGSLTGKPGAAPWKSVAVLPLENLSADPEQSFFADGITDAIITDLAMLGPMKVISRTSVMRYKEEKKSLPEIARDLDVDTIVEGTVLRSGDQVSINVKLIDAATDRHLWAEKYERHLRDIIALQNEVAFAIAQQIGNKLEAGVKPPLAPDRAVNPEAYEAYLRGRYFWNQRSREGTQRAVNYFEKAIAISPDYASAYAGLADCYTQGDGGILGLTRQNAYRLAEMAVEKSLELDNNLAEAHTSLAMIKFQYEWNWPEAEREFKRAVHLNHNSVLAYQGYGELLSALGRHEEAIEAMQHAQKLDPLEVVVNWDLGNIYYMARKYDLAIQQAQKTLELSPEFAPLHSLMGAVYRQKGMDVQAVESYKKALILLGNSPEKLKGISNLEGLFRWRLKEAKKKGADPILFVTLYAALSENDKAINLLEQAYRDNQLTLWLKVAPGLDGLRTESKFRDLLRRVGLDT